jgi:hypothetical protein
MLLVFREIAVKEKEMANVHGKRLALCYNFLVATFKDTTATYFLFTDTRPYTR